MKNLIPLSILLLLLSYFATAQNTVKISKEGEKALDLVAKLPEVINADNYVKKVTNGKRHLFSYLASEPNKDEPYYLVKVAEDNGSAYYTHFIFYVQPKTYQIFYMDTVADQLIPEKQCRKNLMNSYKIK